MPDVFLEGPTVNEYVEVDIHIMTQGLSEDFINEALEDCRGIH